MGDKVGQIDWEALSRQLGLLREDGESSGSLAAQRALELLLGEEGMSASVDYYVAGRPGSELARSVLWLLRPWSAMARCYEIYKHSKHLEDRRMAVELLRVVADRRAIPWVSEFLSDPDEGIQLWGIGVVDQLCFSQLVEMSDVEDLIRASEDHANEAVRLKAAEIREFLGRSGE